VGQGAADCQDAVTSVWCLAEMNVLIYGAGAVGLGVASCLLTAGVSVSIVARKETADAISHLGINRSGIFGDAVHPPHDFFAADSLGRLTVSDYDCVLVCTKSFDTQAAGRDLKHHFGDSLNVPAIVLFQNGWGNREEISRWLPEDRIFNARVITGFTRPDPAHVEITVHANDIHIGHFSGKENRCISELCTAISAGGVPCSPTSAIVADLWAKMLYNCSLNSLGAVFEASYGELADDPHSRALLDGIISECFDVMTGAGFRTHWDSAETYQETFYSSLVPATREHYPSTLQDIRAGKRTEIDALNGSVIKLAEAHFISAPFNWMAYNMVKYNETARHRTSPKP
jgi:2-dehydropantoate 2-reductase